MRRSGLILGMVAGGFVAGVAAAADFVPPKDGKLSERQVVNYIGVLHDQMQAIAGAEKAGNGTSGAAAMAIATHMSQQVNDAIAKHNLTSKEYNWIADRVNAVWPAAMLAFKWEQSGKSDLEAQIKAKAAEEDAAKTKLAAYQKASAAGTRVLTADQLAAATQPATSDRDSALSDIKDDEAAIKGINDEIAQHQKEAADADALAKNPPSDVSADDRAGYIDGKKNDAQTARGAIADCRAKLSDAQKNLDDAKARLAVAEGKLAHPEMPVTDDEKASVKQEDAQGIADAQSTIDGDEQAIKVLKDTLAAGSPGMDQLKPEDRQNEPVVQKHIVELMGAMGMRDALKGK